VELCKGDEVTFNIADKVCRSPPYMHGSSMSLNCIGLPHATVWNIAINHVGPVFKQDLQDSAQACSASYGTVDLYPWSSSSTPCGHLRSAIKSILRSACVCRCQGRRLRRPASQTSPSLHAVSTGQRYVTSKCAWVGTMLMVAFAPESRPVHAFGCTPMLCPRHVILDMYTCWSLCFCCQGQRRIYQHQACAAVTPRVQSAKR